MRSKWIRLTWFWSGVVLGSMSLYGCYVEMMPEDKNSSDSFSDFDDDDDLPAALSGMAQRCDDVERTSYRSRSTKYDHLKCYRSTEKTWGTSCGKEDCQSVPVFVHYMLTQDLGKDHRVYVEAFDNPRFAGTPVATSELSHFSATRAGEYEDTTIVLAPGLYYLRSYLGRSDQVISPYIYGDMELVADSPSGVFGAASTAQPVTVRSSSEEHWAKPVHIYLDKLFKKPGSEPLTKAYLRAQINASEVDKIADNKKLILRLYSDLDFAKTPAHQSELGSESLLIDGRKGKTEIITPSLVVGQFFVFAFVDANSNGYYDVGELAQTASENGRPRLVDIKANRTETVALDLVSKPQLP